MSGNEVTGIVLCGGSGRRVGNADKPLLPFRGRPVIAWVLAALAPQVAGVLISANRNAERYGAWAPVVADGTPERRGPLGGISACLRQCRTAYAFICPGDAPLLPNNLAGRLSRALVDKAANVAVAHDGTRTQNLHLLLRCDVLPGIDRYLAEGHRSVRGWLATEQVIRVDCADLASDFRNLNEPGDFDQIRPD